MRLPITAANPFKCRHYPGDIILWCVRWYLRYPLSVAQMSEIAVERGLFISASCIWRWVQVYQYKSIDVPRITITAQSIYNECSVCVRDNGIGFSPEFAEQLFQPFKRLHGIEIPGSGLGLATSKIIIERSNGRIWAKSQPGEGSTFYFDAPARLSLTTRRWRAQSPGDAPH